MRLGPLTISTAAPPSMSPPGSSSEPPKAVYGSLVGGGVRRSVSWLLAARVVSIVTSIATASVLARLLSPADFGVQAILGIVVLLAAALLEGTFAVPLLQRAEIDPALVSSALWLSVAAGLACMGALILGAPWIGQAAHAPRLRLPLLLTALILPLRALSSVGVALLERQRDYRAISLASMIGNLVYTALAIAMALQGYGLWALVIPTLVQVVLEGVLNTVRARVPLSTAPSRRGVRALFHAGGATTITQLLNWAGLNSPSLITSHLFGAYALGFYARAANLQSSALQLSGGPIGRVLVPTFASLQGAPDKLRDTFKRFLGAMLPLNALVTTVAVVHAEAIVRLLLGRKWFGAIPILQALFLGFLPRSAYRVSEALAMGSGRYGAAAVRQGIYLLAVLAGALIGGHFGILPLTLGVTAGVWVFYALSLTQAEALSGVGWSWIGRAHLQALALALVVGLPDAVVVFWVRQLRHPANPASFKALLMILISHTAGGMVGLGVLIIVIGLFGDRLGQQVAGVRSRGLALVTRVMRRFRPSRAPG